MRTLEEMVQSQLDKQERGYKNDGIEMYDRVTNKTFMKPLEKCGDQELAFYFWDKATEYAKKVIEVAQIHYKSEDKPIKFEATDRVVRMYDRMKHLNKTAAGYHADMYHGINEDGPLC